jgi:RND family efflux transporter MFP subunit
MGTVQISSEKQQMIGVRFGTAEYTSADETIRAVGKVAIDETRVTRVHPKVEGWIERVHIDFTGAEVKKGQPLLTLYSPEMFASQQEYLLAVRARNVMREGGAIDSAVTHSESLIEASRRRLELWDFSKAQIEEVERTGKPIRSITVYAPASGFVTARNSFPSQRVNMDTELYAISDLSRVWVMADVFEGDISKIRIGQAATLRLPMQGAGAISARVNYIQPQVDPQTRTIKVRLEVPNPGLKLKPEMFLDVEFPLGTPRKLTVPADAVLDSGQKQVVFVDRGNGNLEPRLVQVGDRLGDRIVILSGLHAEERIVISANFLIDSESQLKSALAGMGGHQHGGPEAKKTPAVPARPAPPGEHKHD